MTAPTSDLFVSHSGADDEWVRKLVQRLRAAPISDAPRSRRFIVFNDEDSIPKSAGWMEKMLEGVRRSHVMIWVLSPEFLASERAQAEAFTGRGKPLASLLRRDIPQGSVAAGPLSSTFYAQATYFDFRRDEDFESTLGQLVRFLQDQLKSVQDARRASRPPGIAVNLHGPVVDRHRDPRPKARMGLDDAFARVRSGVGVILDERDDEILGCAWSYRDRRLLCAPQVASRVRRALESGGHPALHRVDVVRTRSSAPVRAVIPSNPEHPGILRVDPEGPLPTWVTLRWADPGQPVPDSPVGVVRIVQPRSMRGLLATAADRIALSRWGSPAPVADPVEELSYGNPLFSASAEIVGFLEQPTGAACCASPLIDPA